MQHQSVHPMYKQRGMICKLVQAHVYPTCEPVDARHIDDKTFLTLVEVIETMSTKKGRRKAILLVLYSFPWIRKCMCAWRHVFPLVLGAADPREKSYSPHSPGKSTKTNSDSENTHGELIDPFIPLFPPQHHSNKCLAQSNARQSIYHWHLARPS